LIGGLRPASLWRNSVAEAAKSACWTGAAFWGRAEGLLGVLRRPAACQAARTVGPAQVAAAAAAAAARA